MSKMCCYRLEQLARLGLPSQLFIPAFLQELHHHIPSTSNTFCWQDNSDRLNNIYDEMSNNAVIKQFILSMSSTEPDKYFHSINWISQLENTTTSLELYGKCPFLTEFYKTILLPLGYRNSCFIPIFEAGTKQRLGVLIIHRQDVKSDFTEKERLFLKHISNIIALGLTQTSMEITQSTDGWEQGLLISDDSGNLQYACPTGEKLLALASSSQFNPNTKYSTDNLHVFNDLENLITRLLKPSKFTHNNYNPTLTTTNAWGEFILRGFVIKDKRGVRTHQVGFNIHWQEPFVLKLFHRIKNLNLTPRQETVGLLYAAGVQHQSIASTLNLSLYTVKEHVRNLCDKLDIKTRGDLIQRILVTNNI